MELFSDFHENHVFLYAFLFFVWRMQKYEDIGTITTFVAMFYKV